MRARHSLKLQLLKAGLSGFESDWKVPGGKIDFAWPDKLTGISVIQPGGMGRNSISDEWMIYQVTEALAMNGDAVQVFETLLKGRK
ncbi:MAG: hypothetical protein ABGX41_14370 [Pseudohongiella sp.]